MNIKTARKLAILMVMILLPVFTSGCGGGGLLGGIVGGAGRLIGGAGRLVGAGVLGAGRILTGGGLQVRNDGPITDRIADTLPR